MFIGRDSAGGAFCYDPWVLYADGALDDPNAIVLGKLGQGKSALVKTLLWRMLLFGRRAFVLDVKREYGPLCEAVGVEPISLVPGGGVRLNPLASRPEEHAQLELLRAVTVTALGGAADAGRGRRRCARRCGPCARTATRRADAPGDRRAAVRPTAEMAERLRTTPDAARGRRAPRGARRSRTCAKGRCEGMFDGPTTPGLDLDAKLLVLDLHAVRDSPAVGILMACATAWMSALLARMAERPGRERLINVADESWKIVQHTGLGEWFQSNFKLARQFGVMNLVVLHKLADLQAAGDAGSRAARIAEGLIADASTRIVYHQDESQVPLTRTLLGLSESEARLISMLSAGQALWRVGVALVRRPALPLAARGTPDRHRHRHADQRRSGGAAMNGRSRRQASRTWRRSSRSASASLSAALVWLWGGLAGALFGGGWPQAGRRRAARRADPSAGAPRRPGGGVAGIARALLPGPVGFYGARACWWPRRRRRSCSLGGTPGQAWPGVSPAIAAAPGGRA